MKYTNLIIAGLFLLIGIPVVYAQNIRYVKPIATGDGSGSSWANASDDLQAMINASSIPNNGEVYVAAGTYKPIRRADNMTVITPDDRDNSFVLKRNIRVYGGYPVNGGPRDIIANPTILSGDIGVLNDSTDNCYHVVVSVGSMNNGLLDGFIIRDGNANETTQISINGEQMPRGQGGGLYNANSFQNASLNEALEVVNCRFINNAAIKGGAISNGGFYKTSIETIDCSFIDNTAVSGGGIYNGGYLIADATISRCIFINNTATNNGGAINNGDDNNLGRFYIANSSLTDNNADNGGGVYNGASNPSLSKLINCNLVGNTANEGSVVYTTNNVSPANLEVVSCILWGNNSNNSHLFNQLGSLTASYSIIEGGYVGTGNKNLDPQFTDVQNGDYSLQVSSPAINMGDNTQNTGVDLAGNNRRIGPCIDAGAYESPFGEITPNSEGIVFVNKNVVGGNGNGNSWTTAAPELADALKAAKTNSAITQIWVAKGTYYPLYKPVISNITTDEERNFTFLLVNNVKLYGGFQNANETSISQRDTINLNTILSGDIPGENCYHIVVSVGQVGSACIDGFTIRDGYAVGGPLSAGTISVDGYSVSKSNGAGIYLNESSPIIRNCAIVNNRANNSGGGVYCLSSPISIINCQINTNRAIKGGGVFNSLSSLNIENCSIVNNTGSTEGGGVYTLGNSNYLTNYNVNIKNSLITNNTSNKGSGIYLQARMNVLLTNSTLSENIGVGAIYSENNSFSSVAFRNTILWGNETDFESGSGTNSYTSFHSLIQNRNDFPSDGNLDGTNLANDPLFVNASNGDFTLQPCSPAINTGSNTEYTFMNGDLVIDKDLSNQLRVFDTTIDMGAYELQTPAVTQIIPDFNQISPICNGNNFSLPTLSDNGISGTWSPAENNTQTTTYTFSPISGQCASTDTTVTMTVVVNPLDNATFDYVTNVVCVENTTILPTNISTQGGTFTSTTGLVINSVTGEIDISTSQIGTYTITYTTNQTCPNFSTKTFTIKNLPDASFTYPNEHYCTSASNSSPIVTGTVGSFSAIPSGLSINSTTGVINLSASSEGVYEVTNLIAAVGNCPSDLETVIITVETSPIATISLSDNILTANEVNGASYQWINCANQNPIQGETSSTFTPTASGSYAVIISKGNCSTTSTCKTVSILGITEPSIETINIFPNPANEVLYITSVIPVDIKVIAMDGKIIRSVPNAEMIDLTNVAMGVYSLKVMDKSGVVLKIERIVVNK